MRFHAEACSKSRETALNDLRCMLFYVRFLDAYLHRVFTLTRARTMQLTDYYIRSIYMAVWHGLTYWRKKKWLNVKSGRWSLNSGIYWNENLRKYCNVKHCFPVTSYCKTLFSTTCMTRDWFRSRRSDCSLISRTDIGKLIYDCNLRLRQSSIWILNHKT